MQGTKACNQKRRVCHAVQKTHWRAHHSAILCVDVVPVRNLIVAGSKDNNVTLWTFDGGMLGMLGACCAVLCVLHCALLCCAGVSCVYEPLGPYTPNKGQMCWAVLGWAGLGMLCCVGVCQA